MNLNKLRYIYGFLILVILIGGIYIAKVLGYWDSIEVVSKTNEIVATGLRTPTGKYTLGEIIEGYDLDKNEFYKALKLPLDYPENKKVIEIVRLGEISYEDISRYMEPIMNEFGKQKKR